MKPLHQWIADMENSIEDKSEFSKDMPSSKTTINEALQGFWQQAIQASPIPITTEDEVKDFLNIFTEAFYDYIGWDEWNDIDTDDDAVEYFINLKNKIFGVKE